MQTQRSVLASRPVARRRRTTTAGPLKKATFQIHASVVDAIKAAVQAGVAPSANALVEEAVRDKLRELRRARVYQAYAEAAQDPAFNDDVGDTTRAFEVATADGLRDSGR